MSGNYSRYAHQRGQRHVQANPVQGAMVTDADLTLIGRLARGNTVRLGDTSIRTGVPRDGGVLRYETQAGPADVVTVAGLRAGKAVADGHVAEIRVAPGQSLTDAQGMDLLTKQADYLGAPGAPAGASVLYADLWTRHVGPAEDPRLVDPGFLSAETAMRLEQVAQLKCSALTGAWTEPDLRAAVEAALPPYGDFRLLSAAFEAEVIAPDDCDPCATELVDANLDAGNHLFRLEVHAARLHMPTLAGGDAEPQDFGDQQVTLKFSRDNGSVEIPASAAAILLDDAAYDTAVFELTSLTGEQRLGLTPEGFDDRAAGLFSRADIEAELGGDLTGMILRVWDGAVVIDLSQNDLAPVPVGLQTATGAIAKAAAWTLDLTLGGLALQLQAAPRANDLPFVLPGDAWCVEIREYADDAGVQLRFDAEPVEITHHYAFLGQLDDGDFAAPDTDELDLRSRAFPALTDLTAEDVSWSNHHHTDVDARTVQGAIDLLFDRDPGEGDACLCTYCIAPDDDLADQLEAIAADLAQQGPRPGALICFPAGIWELTRAIKFDTLGSLTLRGAGLLATQINVAPIEGSSPIAVSNSFSLRIEDMHLSSTDDLTVVVLAATGVNFVGLHRAALTVRGRDDLAQIGLLVTAEDAASPLRVRVDIADCAISMGGNALAVGVIDVESHVSMTGCTIARSEQVKTGPGGFGGPGKFTAATEAIAAMKIARRTPAREAEIGAGRYAQMEGNARFIYDMEDIPPARRAEAEAFWRAALPQMTRSADSIISTARFDDLKGDMHKLTWAGRSLAEAGMTAPGAAPARARNGAAVAAPRRARAAGSGSDGMAFMTAAPVSFGLASTTRARIAAFESDLLGAAASVESFVEAMDVLIAATPIATGLPATGLLVSSQNAQVNQVVGNRFLGLDCAIALRGGGARLPGGSLEPPNATTVRDNVVSRNIRTGVVNGGFGDMIPNYAITLFDLGNVTVANNIINQTPYAGMPDNVGALLIDPGLDLASMGYCAIGLQGFMGPKLRIDGNAAHNFRTCVGVFSTPVMSVSPGDNPNYFHGVWLFTENSVFPNSEELKSAAVEFHVAAQTFKRLVRRILRDNHPE